MEKPNNEKDQKRKSTPGMMEFLKEVAFLRIITSPWLTETQMTSRPRMLKTKNLPDTLWTPSRELPEICYMLNRFCKFLITYSLTLAISRGDFAPKN